jgi:hypothetical protein
MSECPEQSYHQGYFEGVQQAWRLFIMNSNSGADAVADALKALLDSAADDVETMEGGE